ncbi:hypothetical protein A2154_01080 [Candidatus Gottesmanbacteria bacterium RBG_16_43_7]|uniref:Transposase IS200-like domain-containing protein n=1 Tax=Candidatus Gottesmanbacteria bacterium RBG_16_43_7 TaxID=1798373 RepID=A0A1F5Z9M1_9BACT|nr:MAG: hypothetical protein A2154_01080 [Candidatus Gottesmanbacteria bacterium RBG_16_43_7]
MRPAPFFTSGYYHIYNRGVDKRKVFLYHGQYKRFVRTIGLILTSGSATYSPLRNQSLALKAVKPKVSILAYCLMPNHYHILVKQTADNGVTEFMHRLNTSYTKYFNCNSNRTGRLFEYTFKSKLIETDDLLLHVSRYIHLNPLLAGIVKDLELYPWSSYLEYIGLRKDTFCDLSEILEHFRITPYASFVNDQVEYASLLKTIEFENDEDALFFRLF